MADFRKLLLALIAGALLFTTVASAQPYSCNATAVPTLARSEGIAEMMGDVLLNCSGTVPVAGILANIRLRLTANITSHVISGSTNEATLILNEGMVGSPAVRMWQGYGTPPGGQNIYQAKKISDDEIEWAGVWLAAAGTTFQTIRITNVRGNAQSRGDFATIYASINIVSPTSVPVDNNLLVVADTRPGMSFSVDAISLKNCEDPSKLGTREVDDVDWAANAFLLMFQEGFASSFRPQDAGTDHSIPGGGYLDESGFNPGALAQGTLADSIAEIGAATQGTRLMARFKDVPDGATLTAPWRVVTEDGLVLIAVLDVDDDGSGGEFADEDFEVDPDDPLVYEVTEVTNDSYSTRETVIIPIEVEFDVPGPLGAATVNGNFAPISTVFTMSGPEPEPRFVDSNSAYEDAFDIGPCRTILLFPYVTNQAQFDTGIAISNTSRDPLGTTNQAGVCKLNYYGNTNGSTGPAVQTTPSVPAGGHFVMSVALGGGVFAYNGAFTACASGNCVAPLFEGYIFAICEFQFAHGFAYVNDNGPSKLGAMGYLALVVPDRGDGDREPQANSLGEAANHGEQLGN